MTASAAEHSRAYFARVSASMQQVDMQEVATVAGVLDSARRHDSTIFFIGNGGSATTASHFATDLGVGSITVEPPFRAVSLTDNQAVITATANDHGYDQVFVRQLRLLAKPNDVVVALSASGNSANLVRAFEFAATVPIVTVALTAFDGGQLRGLADHSIHVPTDLGDYGPAEDIHLMLNHAISLHLRNAAGL